MQWLEATQIRDFGWLIRLLRAGAFPWRAVRKFVIVTILKGGSVCFQKLLAKGVQGLAHLFHSFSSGEHCEFFVWKTLYFFSVERFIQGFDFHFILLSCRSHLVSKNSISI